MSVKQISVFVENKSGSLAKITKVLSENNIDIQALSLADTTDFGILRLIVNAPEKAELILSENHFTIKETEVLAVAIDDAPGGLHKVLSVLEKEGIAIEYMYAFTGKGFDHALVILRVADNEAAEKILKNSGISVVDGEKLYNI